MTRFRPSSRIAAIAALSVLLLASTALAQEERSSGNFLDNLFNRGEPSTQSRQAPQGQQAQPSGRVAQSDPGDISVRLDRMESALRQMTGALEQLQYRNQQLETQLKRMQDDTEYRFQQLGSRGGAALPGKLRRSVPKCRAVFDARPPFRRLRPEPDPNAPGAPRTLGNEAVIAAPEPGQNNGMPVGALAAVPPARRSIFNACRQ